MKRTKKGDNGSKGLKASPSQQGGVSQQAASGGNGDPREDVVAAGAVPEAAPLASSGDASSAAQATIATLTGQLRERAKELSEATREIARLQNELERSHRAEEAARVRADEKERWLTERADELVEAERAKRIAAHATELAAERARVDDELRARLSSATATAEAIEKEAAGVLEEAAQDASRLQSEARKAATGIHNDAAREASATASAALEDAARLRRDMQAEADAMLAKARVAWEDAKAQAAKATAAREQQLDAREAELVARTDELAKEGRALEERRRDLDRRDKQATGLDEALEQEQRRLDEERGRLRLEEEKLGPAAIERLEGDLRLMAKRLEEARAQHQEAANEADQLRGELVELGGDGAGARLGEVRRLQEQIAKLKAELATRPSEEEASELRTASARHDAQKAALSDAKRRVSELEEAQGQSDDVARALRREREAVEAEKRRLEQNLDTLRAEVEELRDLRDQGERADRELRQLQTQLDHERTLNNHLESQLDVHLNRVKDSKQQHFGVLAGLDDAPAPAKLDDAPDLKSLVSDVQVALAKGVKTPGGGEPTKLFFDEHTIRAFFGSLHCADLTLLQGPSGTGKTSLPIAIGAAIGAHVVRVPVQAGWRDRADLLGSYNAFTRSFRGTPFTEAVYCASRSDMRDRPVFVVLDECNLSQMEYYFADLLSELEDWSGPPRIRLFEEDVPGEVPELLEDKRYLLLPRNVRYFGTANQDETTMGIADKTYDRAAVLILEERAKKFPLKGQPQQRLVSWSSMTKRFKDACAKPAYPVGEYRAFIEELEKLYIREFGFGLGNRFEGRIVSKFLPVYMAAGGAAGDGLDHLIRTRIVRRLERLRDPALVAGMRKLSTLLDKQWPSSEEAVRSHFALEHIMERLQR